MVTKILDYLYVMNREVRVDLAKVVLDLSCIANLGSCCAPCTAVHWLTSGGMFSMTIVRVIFSPVSRILIPMEKRRMRKMAAGNMRKAMAT